MKSDHAPIGEGFDASPHILRKEQEEWLAFDTVSHAVTNLGRISLDEATIDGPVVRVIENDPVEGAMSAPLKLFVNVSDRCNLTCSHCSSSSSPEGETRMAADDLKQIADEAAEMGVFQITIGGGEPLIYEDIWEVIAHMRSLHLGVSLTTNALRVKDLDIENLLRYNVRTNVSIDGAPATHDRVRGRQGAYNRTVKNIQRMIDAGILPTIRFTLMNSNLGDVEHMIELAKQLGLPLKPRRAKPSGRVLEGSDIITQPTPEYFRAIVKLNEAENCGLEDLMNLDGSSKDDLILSDADCGAGTRIAYIDEDGSISPCTFLGEDFVSGKWEPGKLKFLWAGSEEFETMRNLPMNSECGGCARSSTCHSECPAMRLHTGGSLDAQDPGCPKPLIKILNLMPKE